MVKCRDCKEVERNYLGTFEDNLCYCDKSKGWHLNDEHPCPHFDEGISQDMKKAIVETL